MKGGSGQSGKEDANRFLKELDTNKELRDRIRLTQQSLLAVARAHGHNFSEQDFHNALEEKWGRPIHRTDEDEAYTCICFLSEAPGV